MTGLLGTLGLDEIPPGPPDGTYNGEVTKSELVVVANKNTLNHVITYKIVDEGYKGETKQEWYKLGENPVDANGQPAKTAAEVVNFTSTMTSENKRWYKKRLMDLGIPEAEINTRPLDSVVGKAVTFNVLTANGFQNIKWVNPRNTVSTEAKSLEDFATAGTSETSAATPAAASNDPGF
jgi:hypothetical protein